MSAQVNAQTREKSLHYVGKETEILCEGYDEKSKMYLGRDSLGRMGYFAGESDLIGKFVKIRVTRASGISLYGDVLSIE